MNIAAKKAQQLRTSKTNQSFNEQNKNNSANLQLILKQETELKKLKTHYSLFILGQEKAAPTIEHQRFIKQLESLKQMNNKSAAENFRLRNLQQKYSTLNNYWQRNLRALEDGTHRRDKFRIAKQLNVKPKASQKNSTGVITDNLYNSLLKQLGDKQVNIDRQKFAAFAQNQIKKLEQKSGKTHASYQVRIKDGKISLFGQE